MRNEIHPGELIAGKYRVRAVLGRSHGLLVDAFHTEFEQRVVIKVLLPGHGDEKEIERFRREARTLAKLESEHVARIIDVGTQPDGSFYLVRQYLEGTDLARYLRQRGPLPLAEAILYVLQTAEAVAETHSHGIIIRELQPSHLFLTQRSGGAPLVKMIDFGTAKLMRDSAAPSAGGDLTATAMFGLSPYASPELIRKAKDVDVRTDVWSLGAILYELLTGRPPFHGEAAFLMLQISKDDPMPVTHLRPDLPPELDQIIGWCLAKDVDARFRNIHAFAHSLAPYAHGEGDLLIQRIGQTTEAAKKRPRVQPSLPAPVPAPLPAPLPAPVPAPVLAPLPAPVPPPAVSAYGRIPPPMSTAGNDDSSTKILAPSTMGGVAGFPSPISPPPQFTDVPPTRTVAFPLDQSGMGQHRPSSPPGYGAPPPAVSQPGYGAPPPQLDYGAPPPVASQQPDYGAPSPAAVQQPGYGAPPAAVSQPGYGAPPPAASQPGHAAQASGSAPMPSSTTPSAKADASPAVGAPPLSMPAAATSDAGPAMSSGSPAGSRNKNLMIGLMAAGAVLVPVLVVALFLAGGKKQGETSDESGAPIAIPVTAGATAAQPAVAAPPPPTETAAPPPPVQPTAAPVAAAPQGTTAPAGGSPPAPTQEVASTGGSKPKTSQTPAPPPAAPSPPPESGGGASAKGTLVAVAMGGSCAFSVNGASKGTASSVRVALAPGRYSVTCKPASGSAKSKSVVVKSGETAMATFRL